MPKSQPLDGALLFARYAFMPNRLGYCGGANARGLFEACAAGEPSPELRDWARQFEGAYPYLTLIARTNGIADPLDARVVEAYWLGNKLLAGVSLAPFYESLRERFAPRLSAKTLNLVLGKIPAGGEPFHAFHVLDVCRRTGALAENLETLDQCRISWGKVQAVVDGHLNVSVQPIVLFGGQLVLGAEETRTVMRQIDGHGFISDVHPGDWVSIHWGWACDKLSARQIENLSAHTERHIALANQTL